MLDPETIRVLAEADEALHVVGSHEAVYITAILVMTAVLVTLIRACAQPVKRRKRVFRELF